MKLPTKTIERRLFKSGYQLIYAVDEVGMGCLAGPVVVCAVAVTNTFYNKYHKKLHWIRDSKLMQAKQREKLSAELLKEKDLAYAISSCLPKTIDKLNIYNAARLAMKRAVGRLVNPKFEIRNSKQSSKIPKLVPSRSALSSRPKCFSRDSQSETISNFKDSNLNIVSNFVLRASDLKSIVLIDGKTKIDSLKMEQLPIVKGDRKVFAIACASIIAKVYRDKLMTRYAKKYPGYGFEKHKGYGTKYHQVQLTAFGPCEIHRQSFRLRY